MTLAWLVAVCLPPLIARARGGNPPGHSSAMAEFRRNALGTEA